jgi:hypothetical protein
MGIPRRRSAALSLGKTPIEVAALHDTYRKNALAGKMLWSVSIID